MKSQFTVLQGDSQITPAQAASMGRRFALSMFPLSPVGFTDPQELPWALLRLGIYGGLAYFTWNKARKISYVLAGCAAVSGLSSLCSDIWDRQKENSNVTD